jgi:hypothetical protein
MRSRPTLQFEFDRSAMTTLAPVQLEAITQANGRRGFAYYMEMGLGKSLTVLTEFKAMKMCGTVERLVVICPNSFKGGWLSEISKHRTKLAAMVFESGKKFEPSPAIDVLIINYEAVRTAKGLEAILAFTNWGKWACYLALDESIKLKNRNSKQSQSIIGKLYKGEMKGGITRMFKIVRLLSGKPITQGPHDLWAQLVAIGAMSMSYYGFQAPLLPARRLDGQAGRRRPERGGSAGAARQGGVPGEEEGLAQRPAAEALLGPALLAHRGAQAPLRRDGGGLPDLPQGRGGLGPDRALEIREARPDPVRLHHQGERRGRVDRRARAQSPAPAPAGDPRRGGHGQGRDRLPAQGHRRLLVKGLRGYDDDGIAWIRGGMSTEAIAAEKQHFERGARVMLLQADAGKYGHTLVGTEDDPCGTMIFFENTYSLDTRSQIEDRIHRMGTVAESCLYVDLSGSDIDERITRALARKENMFQSVFPRRCR